MSQHRQRVRVVDGSVRNCNTKTVNIRDGLVTSKYLIALSKQQYDAQHNVVVKAAAKDFFIADNNQSQVILSWLYDWDRHAHFSEQLNRISLGFGELLCFDSLPTETFDSHDPTGWSIKFQRWDDSLITQGASFGRMVLVNYHTNTYRNIKLLHMHDIDDAGAAAAGSVQKRKDGGVGGAGGAGGRAYRQGANAYLIM